MNDHIDAKKDFETLLNEYGLTVSENTICGFANILDLCKKQQTYCEQLDNQTFINQMQANYITTAEIYDAFQSYFNENNSIIDEFNLFIKNLIEIIQKKYNINNLCFNQKAIIEFLSNIIVKVQNIQYPISYKRELPPSIYDNPIINKIGIIFWEANSITQLPPKTTLEFTQCEMNIYQEHVNNRLGFTNKNLSELNLIDILWIYIDLSKFTIQSDYLTLYQKLEILLLHKFRLDVVNSKIIDIFKNEDMRYVTSSVNFRKRLEKKVSQYILFDYYIQSLQVDLSSYNEKTLQYNNDLIKKYKNHINQNLENIYYMLIFIYYFACDDFYKKRLTGYVKPTLSQYLMLILKNDRLDLNDCIIQRYNEIIERHNRIVSTRRIDTIRSFA